MKAQFPMLQGYPLKGILTLSSYAQVASLRKVVELDAHPLVLEGMPPGPETWTAIYGTASANEAMLHFYRKAAASGKQCHQIRTFVQIRDRAENKGRMSRAQAMHTGCLHVDQITKDFRDLIHELVLSRLKLELDPAQSSALDSLSFLNLMERYPITAQFLLNEFRSVELIIHPVTLPGAPLYRFWAGTIRREERSKHLSEVRYLEDRHCVQ